MTLVAEQIQDMTLELYSQSPDTADTDNHSYLEASAQLESAASEHMDEAQAELPADKRSLILGEYVWVEQATYKNKQQTKHLYGILENGKARHISYDSVLTAYGHDTVRNANAELRRQAARENVAIASSPEALATTPETQTAQASLAPIKARPLPSRPAPAESVPSRGMSQPKRTKVTIRERLLEKWDRAIDFGYDITDGIAAKASALKNRLTQAKERAIDRVYDGLDAVTDSKIVKTVRKAPRQAGDWIADTAVDTAYAVIDSRLVTGLGSVIRKPFKALAKTRFYRNHTDEIKAGTKVGAAITGMAAAGAAALGIVVAVAHSDSETSPPPAGESVDYCMPATYDSILCSTPLTSGQDSSQELRVQPSATTGVVPPRVQHESKPASKPTDVPTTLTVSELGDTVWNEASKLTSAQNIARFTQLVVRANHVDPTQLAVGTHLKIPKSARPLLLDYVGKHRA